VLEKTHVLPQEFGFVYVKSPSSSGLVFANLRSADAGGREQNPELRNLIDPSPAFHAVGASEFVAFGAGHFLRTTGKHGIRRKNWHLVGSFRQSQHRKSFVFKHLVGSFR
jgi:hypothetical protein